MTSAQPIDLSASVAEQLARAEPDLLRSMLSTFIQALMGAEADAVCGAGYGARSPERANSRNGYRHRDFDTRAGTIDLAIPKLRRGSATSRTGCWSAASAPSGPWSGWSRPATCWACRPGGWRSWSRPSASPGCPSRRSRVMASELDEQVEAFRTRPLDAGPVHVRGRRCADAEGPRGRPGGQRPRAARDRRERRRAPGDPRPDVTTAEDGAGWLAFFRDLVARGLSGVTLVTSDAHTGLVAAIGATLPGACLAALPHPLRGEPDGVTPKAAGRG